MKLIQGGEPELVQTNQLKLRQRLAANFARCLRLAAISRYFVHEAQVRRPLQVEVEYMH